MDKKAVVTVLNEMAILLELSEANTFKIRAFQNGSRVVDALEDLNGLVKSEKLTTVRGIGAGLASIITELYKKGASSEHIQLRKKFPKSIFDLLSLQGVGPKKVKILYTKLKIKTLDQLAQACRNNKLKKLEGFSEKTQINILKSIALAKKNQGRFMYSDAMAQATDVIRYIKKIKEVDQLSVGGSLRRCNETAKDIDILIASKKPTSIMKKFVTYKEVNRILGQGKTKSSVTLNSGINVDLRVVTKKEFPYALHYFTGSKSHNTHMRTLAKGKGLKLNEYGLFMGKKNIPCPSENDIFKKLGLSYIPPELREDSGEIEAALKNSIPKNLVSYKDLKGTFHNHTTYSDGANTLEEMIQKACDLGLEYIGISDHSPLAVYANGLKPDRLKKQHAEIDHLQKKYKKIHILKGTECDILGDGKLDYPDTILAKFDFVIASVHSKFNMTEKDMTKRVTKALKNKYVTMIGHPTGRLVAKRDPYPIHLPTLVDVACDYGKAMELNSHPRRLDIGWQICKYAKSKKVPVSINPDAHKTEGINAIEFGVGIARKGWLEKNDVLNTRSYKDIMTFLKSYR